MQFLNAKCRYYLAGTTLYFAPMMWPHQKVTASDKNASTSPWVAQLLFRVFAFVLMCGPGHLSYCSCILYLCNWEKQVPSIHWFACTL